MIVLDENALGLRLDQRIARWYPERVCYVTDLRSGTIIKDETIARLLQRARGATFVTTNVQDFWRHIPAPARLMCRPGGGKSWLHHPYGLTGPSRVMSTMRSWAR